MTMIAEDINIAELLATCGGAVDTLRRVDERAGLVHVHFPRIGFMLKPAPGA